MTIAPAPRVPEKGVNVFERTFGTNPGGNKGDLRFQEGVATDTDVPNDFSRGAYGDEGSAQNPESMYKHANETMQERAHVGSASWIEAPEVLREFVQGAQSGDGMPQFEYEYNSGGHMNRPAAARVSG